MTLNEKVNVELLKQQKERLIKGAKDNLCVGILSAASGVGFEVGELIKYVSKVADNIAFLADMPGNKLYTNNASPNYWDVTLIFVGGMLLAAGFYNLVHAAMSRHSADELADRIEQIEKSPGYTAQAPGQQ